MYVYNYRQQTRHLGINGAQHISGISIETPGRGRRHNEPTTTRGNECGFER